jgi:hypothetical protein
MYGIERQPQPITKSGQGAAKSDDPAASAAKGFGHAVTGNIVQGHFGLTTLVSKGRPIASARPTTWASSPARPSEIAQTVLLVRGGDTSAVTLLPEFEILLLKDEPRRAMRYPHSPAQPFWFAHNTIPACNASSLIPSTAVF